MARAYSTTKAGELLGGLHARDVCTLIKTGKLRAKKQVVRGKGIKARYLVLEDAIDDYLAKLEDAKTAAVEAEEKKPPTKARRKSPRSNLNGVIEFV